MSRTEVEQAIRVTFEDLVMSRAEDKALAEVLKEHVNRDEDISALRSVIFDVAAENVTKIESRKLLEWLEAAMRLLERARPPRELLCEAVFSPGSACVNKLVGLLKRSRRSVDICVFTITDDRISREVIKTQWRGVPVRIITDDDKAEDLGSDVAKFIAAEIDVVMDSSSAHMHNKFAIFDRTTVATGSYNWTRSAGDDNQENIVVCDHLPLVKQYIREFDRLWTRFK